MKKLYQDAASALEGLLFDGMHICAGGFGLCGIPERLIDAIRDNGVKDLTIASNNAGSCAAICWANPGSMAPICVNMVPI